MSVPVTSWSWGNIAEQLGSQSSGQNQNGVHTENKQAHQEAPLQEPEPAPEPVPEPKRRRYYPPRQCRICLETVEPTFETPTAGIASILNPTPRVMYTSEDPELGRLMRPCKCKGSQRHVHEGCLTAWRHADPLYGARNYYECPTCKFQYHFQRIKWGHLISSTFAQLCLTLAILFVTIFVMGFVADPIINFYLDPYSTILSFPSMGGSGPALHIVETETTTWTEHLLKGLASLGMLGFVKIFFAMSSFSWWNIRQTGVFGGGRVRAGTGRNRLENISWTLVIIGIGAFLVTVWKWTRTWSRAVLERAGETVIDVGGDDADDEEEQAEATERANQETAREHPPTTVDPDTRKRQ
ncbi:hypothetical protein SS1G_10385 [Sclerotinia sclerotiorum 1980 UF-70]|uniref:RING-CH-type domain-containing protein n=2 Tax=Sclerotinia sclerotiorum (strain ATCC 18683 / 1980 / Ss-1) TaxID=665079 RepID=A0A1D9QMU3_SCLS1|nr:hypothetical protein SS1G_10385 [Sclerotinia sclerotiorum 1980 UF-70]APA16199.1 hypothetical protein sscle_16g109690 [Sclerotinia sclerotiorum 1980 UF-70]EDN94511.1 hypothetical protein SS1G_10385 [Sclerotinia sclerotiorum 1980 UF-70]